MFYLECLKDACELHHVSCYAYVLMTNHTHLLLGPTKEDGVSKVMKSLGRRYVQYINKHNQRTGTLWEGRHKSSLVDVENYLLCCYRYIELNPVMANMVEHPGDYRWSSYRSNAYGEDNKLIKQHDVYLSLSQDKQNRLNTYRALFNTVLPKKVIHDIRNAANFSMPIGNSKFKDQIARTLNRSIGQAKRGRPVG